MQASQTQTESRFSLALILAAAISALFLISVPAQAETAGALPTPAAVEEAPAAEESTAPVEPTVVAEEAVEEAPVSVSAPEAPVEAEGLSSASTPVDAAPVDVAVDENPAPSPSRVELPVSSAAADDLGRSIRAEVDPSATSVSPPLHDISKAAEETVRDSGTAAVETVKQVPSQNLSSVAPSRSEALDLLDPPALDLIAPPSLDLIASPRIEEETLPVPGPAPRVGSGATPQGALNLAGPIPVGVFLDSPSDSITSATPSDPVGPLGLRALDGITDFDAALFSNLALTGGQDTIGGFNAPAPLENPTPPLPNSPGAAVSTSGGSFFVPIAALLALLALVAPATFRRLREVPDFPAPTPFVCALERPG